MWGNTEIEIRIYPQRNPILLGNGIHFSMNSSIAVKICWKLIHILSGKMGVGVLTIELSVHNYCKLIANVTWSLVNLA